MRSSCRGFRKPNVRFQTFYRPQNKIRREWIGAQRPLYYLFAFLQGQRLPNVGNVIKRLQLRHARAQHHGEQVDEEVSVLPDGQVGFITHFLEPGGRWKREKCEKDKQKVVLYKNIFIQFVLVARLQGSHSNINKRK